MGHELKNNNTVKIERPILPFRQRYFGFPEGLTYPEFSQLPLKDRTEIIQKNRVIDTDTYNRTMDHIQGDAWDTPAVYTLQLRKSPHGYIIASGIEEELQAIFGLPITQSELNFAKEFYAHHARVKHFNAEKWQKVIDEYDGYPPLDVYAVPDGTAIMPGDPIMRVEGPSELVAHFEPAFHRVFYASGVATNAHEIELKVGADRFFEGGKRGVPNEEQALMALQGMYIGGGITLTSNDSGVAAYPQLRDAGTIGHRFVQAYLSEEEAFRTAVEKSDAVSLLVDLTDSYRGIDRAIELKKEFRDSEKKIWIRLDSGNLADQAIYALKKLRDLGYEDRLLDRIVIEDLKKIDDMVAIDEKVREAGFDPKQNVHYGGGSLLDVVGTTRSDFSTGFKLSEYNGEATVKFAETGKESLPSRPTIVEQNGERVIAQVGELSGNDLLIPAYKDGQILFSDDLDIARQQVESTYSAIVPLLKKKEKTPKSEKTKELIHDVAIRYGVIFEKDTI